MQFSACHITYQVYIVYMGSLPEGDYSPTEHHMRILQTVVNSSNSRRHFIRSYKRSFNGFAANLTYKQYQTMAAHNDVVWVFPSTTLKLHTTASWDFMGFPQNVRRNLSFEGDIIIGVIDSGIWPESKSFGDHGFGPIPKKWKGGCYTGGNNFTCNKKIIGARFYSSSYTPRDFVGHGTHTASTAAGNNVQDASFYGIARGVARGGVPSARIAVYCVCSEFACRDEDVMASFDDAIADGVDIITISLGPGSPKKLETDLIAIGALHALEKGILTVHSAGNEGYRAPGFVTSTAPWLFSIGASTTNRKIISKVVLENGKTVMGHAVNSFKLNGTQFPLIYGKDASKNCSEDRARICGSGCLDNDLVRGKIVLCKSYDGMLFAYDAEALGSICLTDEAEDVSRVVPVAASVLNGNEFEQVESYVNSTRTPQANILTSESILDLTAPIVASFSSRGPNKIFPEILKPDIVAPGVDILAAYSPEAKPTDALIDKRHLDYNILSGTSMACPHVTGAAAYIKSLNPTWSPSMIKSALMTTAWQMNSTNSLWGDAEFSYGAGHLDPIKATNPGLVYETPKEDYIKMFCGLKYDSSAVRKIFGVNITCTVLVPFISKDLNYPTMTARVENGQPFSIQFPRRVTNVGLPNSTYRAKVTKSTCECDIKVEPDTLSFNALNEGKSFTVTISGEKVENMASASLEWYDGIHIVRSPIVLYSTNQATIEHVIA
ncbi:subtilisin-like protease SBT4.4 [Coffea arabica]|uniref:Subtilisin-like protease SBT4.4 n=1 Tax=Coffea arabica TaxID=13443 RepID=A0A6P6V2S0_COFAR|nr:subtilisin-like protease SBT4.4 [Coffea arabica]